MTDRAFVDSNVWVYLVDAADPAKRARAAAVLAPTNNVQVVVSAQVMGEFYVTAVRKLARPLASSRAAAIVERMRELPTVAIDGALVAAAIDGAGAWSVSYWDALILVSAAAAGCAVVLSEDLAEGRLYGTVRVENPFAPRRRFSEPAAPYEPGGSTWDEPAMRLALSAYEEACRAAGMTPNAVHSYWDYARRFLDWRTGEYHPRGTPGASPPVPAGAVTAAELDGQVFVYRDAVGAAGLSPATVATYTRHADFFVRWLKGTFRPGARLGSVRSPSRAVGLRFGGRTLEDET